MIYDICLTRRIMKNSMLIKNKFAIKTNSHITKIIDYLSDKPQFVISGGFTAAMMFNYELKPQSDVDIWCLTSIDDNIWYEVITWLKKTFNVIEFYKTCKSVFVMKFSEFVHPVQFVFANKASISEILIEFDFAHLRSAIWCGNTYATYDCINCSKTVGKLQTVLYEETSHLRLDKVSKLGFNIINLNIFYCDNILQFLEIKPKKIKETPVDNSTLFQHSKFRRAYNCESVNYVNITINNYLNFEYCFNTMNDLHIIFNRGCMKRCKIQWDAKCTVEDDDIRDGFYVDEITQIRKIFIYVINSISKYNKYINFDKSRCVLGSAVFIKAGGTFKTNQDLSNMDDKQIDHETRFHNKVYPNEYDDSFRVYNDCIKLLDINYSDPTTYHQITALKNTFVKFSSIIIRNKTGGYFIKHYIRSIE